MNTGAIFSDCRRYRYVLWRTWDETKPQVVFLLMNPSTAGEVENDPTVERCVRRVQRWMEIPFSTHPSQAAVDAGIGGVTVLNAFAWRETDSRLLVRRIKEGVDIVGPDNDVHIIEHCKKAALVVCGWGKPGHALLARGHSVAHLLASHHIKYYCLAKNEDNSPKHPLYVGYNVAPFQVWP